MAGIRLERVSKAFGGVVAVAGVDLDVPAGEWLVVTGPRGSGKSSLLRLIAGDDTPTSGRIIIDGRDVSSLDASTRQVAFIRSLSAVKPSAGTSPAGGIRRWLHPPAAPVPAPEQFRAALSRATATPTGLAILLADDPLAGLDPVTRSGVRAELHGVHRRAPVTVIHATGDQDEALALGHRVAVMIGGRIVQVGPPLLVYERPATLGVAAFIGEPAMNLIAGTVAVRQGRPTFQAGGRVLAPLPPGAMALAGMPVTIGVRPTDVRFACQREGLLATIESVEPTGPAQRVRATLSDGWPLIVIAPARPLLAAGMPARVTFDADRLHIFGADGRRFVAADAPAA